MVFIVSLSADMALSSYSSPDHNVVYAGSVIETDARHLYTHCIIKNFPHLTRVSLFSY